MFVAPIINKGLMLLCLTLNYPWPDAVAEMKSRVEGLLLAACIDPGMAKKEVEKLAGVPYVELGPIYQAGYSKEHGFYFGRTAVQRYDPYGVAVIYWNDKVQEVRFKPLISWGVDEFDDWIWYKCANLKPKSAWRVNPLKGIFLDATSRSNMSSVSNI